MPLFLVCVYNIWLYCQIVISCTILCFPEEEEEEEEEEEKEILTSIKKKEKKLPTNPGRLPPYIPSCEIFLLRYVFWFNKRECYDWQTTKTFVIFREF